ncbi:MAG: amidohydrolase [Actinomycetota bacterium]
MAQVLRGPAHRALTPEIAEAASLLCYSEGVRFGTTSVMDMWRFMEGSARAAEQVGIRATLVPYVADGPGFDYFESLECNRRLLETHSTAAEGRVRTWVGLEHLFYCTPEAFREAARMAEEFGTGLHTHSSETIWEVQESLRLFGRRPIEEFFNRGILGARTVVAHCVWLDDREIQLLAETGTSVAHCPCSNMKIASGPARIGDMRAAGIAVGLGSDGEKENNNLDLLEEMKFASLLQKVSTLDPTRGDHWDVLSMATLEGARALGLADVTGSLEPGKRADVVTVDLRALHMTPVLHGDDFNVAAHLVFSASGHDVDRVWVDGRPIVDSGRVLTVDTEEVRVRARPDAARGGTLLVGAGHVWCGDDGEKEQSEASILGVDGAIARSGIGDPIGRPRTGCSTRPTASSSRDSSTPTTTCTRRSRGRSKARW